MTKKRKRYPDLDQKLERPWCFYCERDFDDLKILISHQKAKHFKCDRCGRRLNTAGGLSVHMNQVHKENLTHVENAIPGRQGLDIEIFGMEGVPGDILDQHNQQVTQKHFAEEAERARITGNPVRGLFSNGTAPPTKRPKVTESLDDIEERANKYRHDRQNGILPPPSAADAVPAQPTPPAAAAYGAPPFPAATAAGFPPPGAPFASGASILGRPGSTPGQAGALPPRPGFANGGGEAQTVSASVEDLIGQARREAAPEERKEEKKKKAANIKLVFYDESVSPEEKMALLPRFAEFARA